MSDWGGVRFRRWLGERVLDCDLGRVCCVAVYEKRVDDVVDKTGLSASMVEEVGRAYEKRVVAAGRPVPTGPRKSTHGYPQLNMRVPEAVFPAWEALAERLHMRSTMALRTLLHEYLLGAEEPLHRDSRWVLDGYVVGGGPETRLVCPGVTHGALAALNMRAERLGMPHRHLLRCLMVDALAGRRRIGAPIHRSVMYDDPKRYRS